MSEAGIFLYFHKVYVCGWCECVACGVCVVCGCVCGMSEAGISLYPALSSVRCVCVVYVCCVSVCGVCCMTLCVCMGVVWCVYDVCVYAVCGVCVCVCVV